MYERTIEGQVPNGAVNNSRNMADTSPSAGEVRELIASRAYELYKRRDAECGDELSDWLNAEAEVVTMLLAEPQETDAPEKRNGRTPARTRIATGVRKGTNGAGPRVSRWSKSKNSLKSTPA